MATRAQAKTAIDNTAVAVKADIDAFLPSGVNIVDGSIRFNPGRSIIQMTEPNRAAALSLSTAIQALLTAGGKSFTVNQARRERDVKFLSIKYGPSPGSLINTFHISFI